MPKQESEDIESNVPANSAAHKTGRFLLLTAIAMVVMVITRVLANADQPILMESVWVIAQDRASRTALRRYA